MLWDPHDSVSSAYHCQPQKREGMNERKCLTEGPEGPVSHSSSVVPQSAPAPIGIPIACLPREDINIQGPPGPGRSAGDDEFVTL